MLEASVCAPDLGAVDPSSPARGTGVLVEPPASRCRLVQRAPAVSSACASVRPLRVHVVILSSRGGRRHVRSAEISAGCVRLTYEEARSRRPRGSERNVTQVRTRCDHFQPAAARRRLSACSMCSTAARTVARRSWPRSPSSAALAAAARASRSPSSSPGTLERCVGGELGQEGLEADSGLKGGLPVALGVEVESRAEDQLLAGQDLGAASQRRGQTHQRIEALGAAPRSVDGGDLEQGVEAASGHRLSPRVADTARDGVLAEHLPHEGVCDGRPVGTEHAVDYSDRLLDLGAPPAPIAAQAVEPLRGLRLATERLGARHRHPSGGYRRGLRLLADHAPSTTTAQEPALTCREGIQDDHPLGGRVGSGADQVPAVGGAEDEAELQLNRCERASPSLRLAGRGRATRRGAPRWSGRRRPTAVRTWTACAGPRGCRCRRAGRRA